MYNAGCNHQVPTDLPIKVSASGSWPKESPFYPSSVILSPVKNKELSHATEVCYSNAQSHTTKVTSSTAGSTSTVTSTGTLFQSHGQTACSNAFVMAIATNNNSSLPFNSVVPNNSTTNQMSSLANNVLVAPAPPPLNSALQPRLFRLQSQHGGRIPSSGSTPSATNNSIIKQPVFNGDEQSVNTQDGVCKDPSSELVEQHNVRVVPAVLSFDSPSLFSPSVCAEQSSLSLSNILQSSSEILVNGSSSSKAVTLSQLSSVDNHSQSAHPQVSSKAVFSNMSPQWISGKSPYVDNQVCVLILTSV